MPRLTLRTLLFAAAGCSAFALLHAAGKVEGKSVVNGKPAPLTFATAGTAENLLDSKKRDVLVLLADKPIPPDVKPDDDVAISLHARKGEFRAIMLRIDDAKTLRNVKLFDAGINGVVIFGRNDFELTATRVDAKGAAGKVRTKAPTTFEKTTIELDATFDVTVDAAPAAPPAPVAAAAPVIDRSEALNQLLRKHLTFTANDFLTAVNAQKVDDVKLFLDAGMSPETPGGQGTPLFATDRPIVWALMMKNEPMALALVKAGADAKKADKDGMTALTWAVETCSPAVVQALVDAKADVNHKRAGMTMLQEAGACPAAETILKKAGAR